MMIVSGKHLYESVKAAIRTLKGRRRDQAAFFVAALFFSVGFALTRKLIPDFNNIWIARLQIAFYVIGAIAFVYGGVRVWKLVNPPELPPAKDRPPAIKGPTAFTEADGELFRKLGRENELQKLLGFVLDNQILMIVVRGASGAGKTSLLRAGLKHILGDRVSFHYWEAVPTEPDKGLLRAIQESWPESVAKPATLAEVVNPSDTLGRQSHVIVLDQFEQLRGNRKIFQLLHRIIRESKPPHRITWVIAFRREFSADWLDFISPEQENGFRPPQDISLRLFTAEQAREVIGQLINESDLKDSIEQSVIDNLVEAATVDVEVSPVDIGIGLLVLTELHERQSGERITKRDYQFAGGAEGLLTQYISRCLEPFSKESQEAILKAMLALRDPEENRQRLATGLTIDELAMEAGIDARVLKLQLNRLADRDIRLLEAETPKDSSPVRYRLPHERLIPALYRLTGKLLAEVDQAKIKFQNAFQAWQTNDKRSRYLLKGKELRLVQRYETQIPWGKDEQEKKTFLFRSKRRRQLVGIATVATLLALIAAGWLSILQYQRFENRRYLTENGYPPELYDYQHQLKKLELTEPLNLENFTWLSSDSIEELSLTAANSSNSIAGLTSLSRCRSLKKLTLDLSYSQVSDLHPLEQLQGLTQLTLNLGRAQVSDLHPLEQLEGLTQLTLNLSSTKVSSLSSLVQLQGLTQLSLDLRATEVTDLQPLRQLKGLTQLSLDLSGQLGDLQLLTELKGLTQLTLNLGDSKVSDLQLLAQLNGLTQLTLDVSRTQLSDVRPLAQLKRLTQLTLNVRDSKVRDLQPLQQLQGLAQLTLYLSSTNESNLQSLQQVQLLMLHFGGSEVRDLQLPAQLKELTLDLSSTQVRDLQLLEQLKELTELRLDSIFIKAGDLQSLAQLKGLTHLTLGLTFGQVSDVQALAQLRGLTQLTLYLANTKVSNLESLVQLQELTQLTLDLTNSNVSTLPPLQQLQGLTQLTLELTNTNIRTLPPLAPLKGLTQLTLDLTNSNVSTLPPLQQLQGLTQLTLGLGGSQVSNLELVRELSSLHTLSIETGTRTQRMSLRSIPPSVVELKF